MPSSLFPALLVSVAATAWCWWATGVGLGLFLGATLLASAYVPALSLSDEIFGSWRVAGAATVGVSLCWLGAITFVDVTFWEWCRCALVLAGWSFALAGFSMALRAAQLDPPTAAGITVLLGLLWLTWPVWLSPWLTQQLSDRLVVAHPLLAINGVLLKQFGSWDRTHLAYSTLTVLNQDIAYQPPASILPAVIVQLTVALAGMAVARLARGRCDDRHTRYTPAPPPPA